MWQYVQRPSIPDLRGSGCGLGNGQARQLSKAAVSNPRWLPTCALREESLQKPRVASILVSGDHVDLRPRSNHVSDGRRDRR